MNNNTTTSFQPTSRQSEVFRCLGRFVNYPNFVDAGKLFEPPVDREFTVSEAIKNIEETTGVRFVEQMSLRSFYYRYFENKKLRKYAITCTSDLAMSIDNQIGILYLITDRQSGSKLELSTTRFTGIPTISLQSNRGYTLIRGLAHSVIYAQHPYKKYTPITHMAQAIFIENVIRKKYGHEYSDLIKMILIWRIFMPPHFKYPRKRPRLNLLSMVMTADQKIFKARIRE